MSRSSTRGPVVVLVGPPGAGKTTVGRLVARGLGVDFLDTDDEIEKTCGTTIPELFANSGEAGFRAVEHETVTRVLRDFGGVVALGGGAVMHPGTRELLADHPVAYLEVEASEAVSRVGSDHGRPLLTGDPVGRLQELLRERRPVYEAVATMTVPTGGQRPEEVARQVLALIGDSEVADPPSRIVVTGADPYEVLVGWQLSDEVVGLVGPAASRVLVLHPPTLATPAEGLRRALREAGRDALVYELPDAEAAKTIDVAAAVWDFLGEQRFGREDVIVGLGGGATTDLAGFVAATWLRGVGLVNVPTTLLGMVDAAVGGKTGVNTAAGKNLVGAIHPPAGVVCDLAFLETLAEVDLRAGLAEVVKCGFIADERILQLVEADGGAAALDARSPVLRELVERAVAVKARVVGEDLREMGLREILNYGHTLGHAVERAERFTWRHGDAVAVGMVFAAELAAEAGLLDPQVVERHRRILTLLGLPVSYPRDQWSELAAAMLHDKKVRGDQLRFLVLEDVGRPTVLAGPSAEQLERAWSRVGS